MKAVLLNGSPHTAGCRREWRWLIIWGEIWLG